MYMPPEAVKVALPEWPIAAVFPHSQIPLTPDGKVLSYGGVTTASGQQAWFQRFAPEGILIVRRGIADAAGLSRMLQLDPGAFWRHVDDFEVVCWVRA